MNPFKDTKANPNPNPHPNPHPHPKQAKNPFKDTKGPVGLFSKFCIAQFTAIAAGFISYPGPLQP